ncbi:hypothetical protein WS90_25095 [Burkholderia cepacia]|uniref:Uncharacterized protein n=1 Tax=Burkholderia cepacia TaxID=292 RepID=A0A103Z9M1_BURCE|nr:hypothetical protein WS90_25095 [Burkholderia cepacia]
MGARAVGALPEDTRTLDDSAAHASALLDALDIECCAVFGLSIGGMWGARLASREPERVRARDDGRLAGGRTRRDPRYGQMPDAIEAAGAISPPWLDALAPDADHISNLENPTFVTWTLLEWFDEQKGP